MNENCTKKHIYEWEVRKIQLLYIHMEERTRHRLDAPLLAFSRGGKSSFPHRNESFFVVLAASRSGLSLIAWSFRCWFCWTIALTKEEFITGFWWWPCRAEGETMNGLILDNSGSGEKLYGSLLSSILRNVMDILHDEIVEHTNIRDD